MPNLTQTPEYPIRLRVDAFSYDANGNMTAAPVSQWYVFDVLNGTEKIATVPSTPNGAPDNVSIDFVAHASDSVTVVGVSYTRAQALAILTAFLAQDRATQLSPPPAPVITSAATLSAPLGQPLAFQVTASNQPTGFSVDALPDGLALDPVAGTISGTPTTAGTYTANLSATNIQGSGTQALVITVS
jgi:hypothetical protein